MLSIRPAVALDSSSNVAFTAVNLSPWAEGQAVDLQQEVDLSKSFNVDLPNVSGDPVGAALDALSSLLGIPLPIDIGVSVGPHADGNVALDLGYAVSGGRVNLNYPAVGTITVPTVNGTNQVTSSSFQLTSQFQSGLQQVFVPSAVSSVELQQGGYALGNSNLGFDVTKMKDPIFTTSFPSFAAWADASYNVNLGISLNADLKVLGACVVCASQTFTIHSAEPVPLVDISGSQVSVLGQTVGSLPTTIAPVDGLTATVNSPNLKVTSDPLPAGGTTLTGSGSQQIIGLNVNLDDLLPIVDLLSNQIGPFGYNLLSLQGGPTLSLYQDFSFAPHPQVKLDFSQPLLVGGSDGVFRPTNSVTFNLGDALNIEVPVGTTNDVTIHPTYILDDTFTNQTGIAVGASLMVDGPALETPFGDLGPLPTATLTSDPLLKLPLYDNTFDQPLGTITANPFTIDVGSQLSAELTDRYVFDHVSSTDTAGDYDIAFRDTQTGNFIDVDASGQITTLPGECTNPTFFCDPNAAQGMLITDEDVYLPGLGPDQSGLDLGDAFCVVCQDLSSAFADASPSISDDQGDQLYLTDLSSFPSGECESNIGICDGTFAAANEAFNPAQADIVTAGPLTVVQDVPEPGVLPLLAGAGGAWLLVDRLRRRRRVAQPRVRARAPLDALVAAAVRRCTSSARRCVA